MITNPCHTYLPIEHRTLIFLLYKCLNSQRKFNKMFFPYQELGTKLLCVHRWCNDPHDCHCVSNGRRIALYVAFILVPRIRLKYWFTLVLNLFLGNIKIYICIFYHFSTRRWRRLLKSFLVEDKDLITCRVNIMVADDLATLGARASAAMVLT